MFTRPEYLYLLILLIPVCAVWLIWGKQIANSQSDKKVSEEKQKNKYEYFSNLVLIGICIYVIIVIFIARPSNRAWNYEFESPAYLYLLLLLIPMIVWYVWQRKKITANMQISTIQAFVDTPKSYKYYLIHVPFILRVGALFCLIVALARPQSVNSWASSNVEGIDIMLTMDISTSMLAEDFSPNRIEAAKTISAEFITERKNDNIGLTIFAGESFTQSPLTTDKASLLNLLNNVDVEMMLDDPGTAIGRGLANAINRLRSSQAKSRIIILLTDGTNNTGEIDPITAAELAKSMGIRVYTIGVGTRGMALAPVLTIRGMQKQWVKVDIDEKVLTEIANLTGGKYFRATDNKSLTQIYDEIDQLETSEIQVNEYAKKDELYMPFAMIALGLLLLEILLRSTILRHNP
jgi:Ca-activated chloride channel family protein